MSDSANPGLTRRELFKNTGKIAAASALPEDRGQPLDAPPEA